MKELVRVEEFNAVTNKSLARSLADVLTFEPRVMTPEEIGRLDRLRKRLSGIGVSLTSSYHHRSIMAEHLFDLQQDGDWEVLIDPETDKPYRWYSFRKKLSEILGISTGAIGRYLKLVRYGREVLEIPEGDFANVGGIATVGVMVDDYSAGIDGRQKEHFALTVRPRSSKLVNDLESRFPGRTYAAQLRLLFNQDVAYDFKDPEALNKPPSELREQARKDAGAPTITFGFSGNGSYATGLKWHVCYPDVESTDGQTVLGKEEIGEIVFDNQMPHVVREHLAKKLGIRS